MDSLNKIIEVCNISFDEFFALAGNENEDKIVHSIPYIECSRLLEGEKDNLHRLQKKQMAADTLSRRA